MADLNPEFPTQTAFIAGIATIGLIIASLGGSGCGRSNSSKAQPAVQSAARAPEDRMEVEREQIRQGATQLTQAISSLHDAIDSLKGLQKSSKDADLLKALTAMSDSLDAAGVDIADYSTDPPALAEFKLKFSAEDTRRLKAIEGANDALHELDDATDALDPFLDHSRPEDKDAINDLESSMEDAQDALIEAIKSFGGSVENDDSSDITNDVGTNPAVPTNPQAGGTTGD